MVLLYLALLVVMMFVGGMLIQHNPEPVVYRVAGWSGEYTVTSSVLEIVGLSMLVGAVLMAMPYLRLAWGAYRERRRLERDAADLRSDNTALRRDVENQRTEARLLEARLAEAEERYAQLQAEVRPLLEAKREAPAPDATATSASPQPPRPASASRWRRR